MKDYWNAMHSSGVINVVVQNWEYAQKSVWVHPCKYPMFWYTKMQYPKF